MIDSQYFKAYRAKLGFNNQAKTKEFLGAKDIVPTVDYAYIALLNHRLVEIVNRLNLVVAPEIQPNDADKFCQEHIFNAFETMKEHGIILRLNNQGRRPEEVCFSWLRGFVIANYFLKAVSYIFDVDTNCINLIGDDDLKDIENFKRTPKADLEITINNQVIRIEIQSGFQNINDIKQHKVIEAKKIKNENDISSILLHFDLYNGQVAFVQLDNIEDDSVHWVTRQQMEGQTVFNINQNYFVWKLTELPPKYSDLEL